MNGLNFCMFPLAINTLNINSVIELQILALAGSLPQGLHTSNDTLAGLFCTSRKTVVLALARLRKKGLLANSGTGKTRILILHGKARELFNACFQEQPGSDQSGAETAPATDGKTTPVSSQPVSEAGVETPPATGVKTAPATGVKTAPATGVETTPHTGVETAPHNIININKINEYKGTHKNSFLSVGKKSVSARHNPSLAGEPSAIHLLPSATGRGAYTEPDYIKQYRQQMALLRSQCQSQEITPYQTQKLSGGAK